MKLVQNINQKHAQDQNIVLEQLIVKEKKHVLIHMIILMDIHAADIVTTN